MDQTPCLPFSAYFREVRDNLEQRRLRGQGEQDPNVLVELFNAAVDHLSLVCCQVRSRNETNFARKKIRKKKKI
jgi:hypothetical protein